MDENKLVNDALKLLNECLESISFLKISEILTDIRNDKISADLWVKFADPANYPDMVVEVKNNGEPRFIRNTVNQLLRYLDYIPNSYGLIIAPYISKNSAEICKEAGVGYIDLTGNCFIAFKQVYIEKEGKASNQLEKRVLKSIYYPKAERVLRVLLNHPNKLWKIQSLSQDADVSLGMASKVKQRLEAMEWLSIEREGFRLVRWDELIKDWQEHFKYSKNEIYDLYSLKTEKYLEEQLKDFCLKNNIRWGLTMFSGASKLAPYTRFKKINAYIEKDIEKLIKALDLRPVTSGASITLIKPYDSGLFYRSEEYDGMPVVSPVQIYLDLNSNKGRGEDAAQFLYERVIKTSWSQNMILKNGK